MTRKRASAWAVVAANLLFGVSPALAEIHDYVHADGDVTITGIPYVGRTLTASVPSGASCVWLRSGTPISGATSCSYTIQAADASAGANALTLQVTTTGKTAYTAISIAGSCTTTATVGSAYGGCTGVAASNGSGGYTYALSGAWPAGISINPATGAPSGSPAAAGTFANLSVTATDSVGGSAAITPFTLTVSGGGGGGGSPSFDFSQSTNSQYVSVVF